MAGQLEQSGTEQKQTTQQERMVQQFGQSLATKILMILIRLGRNAILARVLGPADRGLFSLISSIPELIMVAGNAGLANSAAYHTAKKTRPLHTIVANVNVQILLISTLLFLLSFWVVEQHWLNKDYEEAVVHFRWFIAFAIPLMLFALGVRMTSVDFSNWRIGTYSAVLCPASGVIIALVCQQFLQLNDTHFAYLVVFGALPPAVLNYMVAERYNQEPHQVASIVLLGNIGSLLFIPLTLAFVL